MLTILCSCQVKKARNHLILAIKHLEREATEEPKEAIYCSNWFLSAGPE